MKILKQHYFGFSSLPNQKSCATFSETYDGWEKSQTYWGIDTVITKWIDEHITESMSCQLMMTFVIVASAVIDISFFPSIESDPLKNKMYGGRG